MGDEDTQPHHLATEIIWPYAEGSMERADLERICAEAIELPLPPRRNRRPALRPRTLPRPDPGLQGRGRPLPGPRHRPLQRQEGHRPRRHQRRHRQRRRPRLLQRRGHRRGPAVPKGPHQQGPGTTTHHRRRQRAGAWRSTAPFDDCQAMVKEAFLDAELQAARPLTSANSINIARWIPQATYYASTVHMLGENVLFSVPSGNYGNLAAGLLAHKMGMPCKGFIAATNANSVVPEYLETGDYQPRAQRGHHLQRHGRRRPQQLHPPDPPRSVTTSRPSANGPRLPPRRRRHPPAHPPASTDTSQYVCDPHGAIGHAALDAPLQQDQERAGRLPPHRSPLQIRRRRRPRHRHRPRHARPPAGHHRPPQAGRQHRRDLRRPEGLPPRLSPKIRHVLPVGLRPPKFQSVNPPSLRSIGIPETTHGESVARIVVAPVDVWIVEEQAPEPSIAAIRGRTPPEAVGRRHR